MSEMRAIVEQIQRTRGCVVLPPAGLPVLRARETLPPDLAGFYRLCGGVELFRGSEYPMRIVEPQAFVRSNPAIGGEEAPDDITDSWCIVARGGSEEAISIDCNQDRLGRCYGSFWDRHGVAGSCPIIALSFAELLQRLVGGGGSSLYWLVDGGVGYGDAYRDGRIR